MVDLMIGFCTQWRVGFPMWVRDAVKRDICRLPWQVIHDSFALLVGLFQDSMDTQGSAFIVACMHCLTVASGLGHVYSSLP